MLHPVGTRIRTNSTISKRFRDRLGTIVSINDLASPHIEYGVSFKLRGIPTASMLRNARTEAWFISSEIEPLFQKFLASSESLGLFSGFNSTQ